jgi:CBS domain-containing protein
VKAKKIKVDEAMTEHVYTCTIDAPLGDVAAMMEEKRYGCAVVLQDDYVVGIFTTTDALRAVRTLIAGKKVERKATATHLVDVTGERERVEHRVRLSDALRGVGPRARDGLIGTAGL